MTGNPAAHTIRVNGKIMDHPVHILVDTSSTHSFINDWLVKKFNLPIQSSHNFHVLVATGEQLEGTGICQNILLKCQELEMPINLLLLPLEGCQIVFGVQWLSLFDDIIFNFKNCNCNSNIKGRTSYGKG